MEMTYILNDPYMQGSHYIIIVYNHMYIYIYIPVLYLLIFVVVIQCFNDIIIIILLY